MIYLVADTHFNHDMMIESGLRPKEYERKLIRNWNRQVKDEDIVILLGDISWRNDYSVLEKLHGRKILVRGNHDKHSCEAFMKVFDFACDSFTMDYMGINIIFTHKPLKRFSQDVNIHGHLHDKPALRDKRHILISLEKMGYCVFPLKGIIKKWKKLNMEGC